MASLLQLPSVLVEDIFDFLSDQDALQFRCACRTLKDDVNYSFKHRFFKERTVSMTEESIQNLIDFSNTDLVSAIQTFTFVDNERKWDTANVWRNIRNLNEVPRFFDASDPSKDVQRNRYLQDLEREQQKVEKLEDGLAHVLWKLASTKLLSLRFQLFHFHEQEHSCDAFVSSSACFLRAFATVGSTISAITVRVGSIPLGTYKELLPYSQQLSHCFANLKTLDISVPCAEEGSDAFVNFLILVSTITKLGLRFAIRSMDREGPTQTFFSKIAKAVNFPRLTALCLTDIKFNICDLEALSSASPLTKLTLKESGLASDELLKLASLLRAKYRMEGPREEQRWVDKETRDTGLVGERFDEIREGKDPLRFIIRRVLIWSV